MAVQPSPSEIVNLLLIVVLVPLTGLTVRRFVQPGHRLTMIGYGCIVVAVVLAVVEHPLQIPLITDMKNVLYACGGIAFATGIWQLNFAVRRGEAR